VGGTDPIRAIGGGGIVSDVEEHQLLTVRAPAKLNLGLEVVGRRDDGYHEVVTILQTVAIFDDLTLAAQKTLTLTSIDAGLAETENLGLTALARLQAWCGETAGAAVHLSKGIPIAAGLGGASSDAAAALLGARHLWKLSVSDERLAELALTLGSDVPFFLTGGTALATGRGERLVPLPTLVGTWFVVVSPRVAIPRKTATLYGALSVSDFSEGEAVRAQAARLGGGAALEAGLLGNAFQRALYAMQPELADLPGLLRRYGATTTGLSGAGPSHYAVMSDRGSADRLAGAVAAALGDSARVMVAAPVDGPPVIAAGLPQAERPPQPTLLAPR